MLCCRTIVVVDNAAHHIPAVNPTKRMGWCGYRTLLIEALMGPGAIEIGDVFAEHPLEVPLIEDQQVIETFLPHRADPALGVRIRFGCVVRCSDDRDTLSSEYGIKGGGEFRISVVDQEAHRDCALLDLPTHLPRLLCHPGRRRAGRAPSDVDPSRAEFNGKQDVDRRQPNCFDCKKVARQDLVLVMTKKGPPTTTMVSTLACGRNVVPLEYISNRRSANGVA